MGAFSVDSRAYAEAIRLIECGPVPAGEAAHAHVRPGGHRRGPSRRWPARCRARTRCTSPCTPGPDPLILTGGARARRRARSPAALDYPPDAPECFPRMEAVDWGGRAHPGRSGPVRFTARDVWFDAERRIEARAAAGVDAEVSRPIPPLLNYELPAADGLALARYVNEYSRHPVRGGARADQGLGMVPLQDPGRGHRRARRRPGPGAARGGDRLQRAGEVDRRRAVPAVLPGGRTAGAVGVRARDARPSERLPMAAMGTYIVGRRGRASRPGRWSSGGTAAACPDLRHLLQPRGGRLPADADAGAVLLGRVVERGAGRPDPGGHARRRPVAARAGPPVLVRLAWCSTGAPSGT